MTDRPTPEADWALSRHRNPAPSEGREWRCVNASSRDASVPVCTQDQPHGFCERLHAASARPVPSVPPGCVVDPVSSRGCERGTLGCTITHPSDPPPERPGGWVEGIGWVAWLSQLADRDWFSTSTHGRHLLRMAELDIVAQNPLVVVQMWTDGTVPAPSAAPSPDPEMDDLRAALAGYEAVPPMDHYDPDPVGASEAWNESIDAAMYAVVVAARKYLAALADRSVR